MFRFRSATLYAGIAGAVLLSVGCSSNPVAPAETPTLEAPAGAATPVTPSVETVSYRDALVSLGALDPACADRHIRDSIPNQIDAATVLHKTWWVGGCGTVMCSGTIEVVVVDDATREIAEWGSCVDGERVEGFEELTSY